MLGAIGYRKTPQTRRLERRELARTVRQRKERRGYRAVSGQWGQKHETEVRPTA